MKVHFHDVNGFGAAVNKSLVSEVMKALEAMPLPVKKSDQQGRRDRLVFNPKEANALIEEALKARGWTSKIPIPAAQQALGIDVDFGKGGLLVEAQFSNYPFLLNNVVRTNVLFNGKVPLERLGEIKALLIITKAKIFEAANSTLYYEQAVNQLNFLMTGKSIQVPTRIVGLIADRGSIEPAVLTSYETDRYSRTVVERIKVKCRIGGDKQRERERLVLVK